MKPNGSVGSTRKITITLLFHRGDLLISLGPDLVNEKGTHIATLASNEYHAS